MGRGTVRNLVFAVTFGACSSAAATLLSIDCEKAARETLRPQVVIPESVRPKHHSRPTGHELEFMWAFTGSAVCSAAARFADSSCEKLLAAEFRGCTYFP